MRQRHADENMPHRHKYIGNMTDGDMTGNALQKYKYNIITNDRQANEVAPVPADMNSFHIINKGCSCKLIWDITENVTVSQSHSIVIVGREGIYSLNT